MYKLKQIKIQKLKKKMTTNLKKLHAQRKS